MEKYFNSLLVLFLLFSLSACETKPEPTQAPVPTPPTTLPEPIAEPAAESALDKKQIPAELGIVTGSNTGTYIKIGRDLEKIAAKVGIKLIVKSSGGSLENIRRLNSSENAALGIVQADVLGYLKRHPNKAMRRFSAPLRVLFPLYNEEVHLFARKHIKSIKDLNGQRVVVGSPSSGNYLTAKNLMGMMKVTPGESLEISPEAGLMAVLRGDAEAMFYVAGKPVDLFSRLSKLQKEPTLADYIKEVHFVPLNTNAMLGEYHKASITPKDYPWLTSSIPTVSVKAILIAYNFSSRKDDYYQARCDQVAQLKQAITSNFEQLKREGHPKWRQVSLKGSLTGWRKDQCK